MITIARSVPGEKPPPSLCYYSNPSGKLPQAAEQGIKSAEQGAEYGEQGSIRESPRKHPIQGDDVIARSRRRRSKYQSARHGRMYSLPIVVPQTAKMSRMIWLSSKLSIRSSSTTRQSAGAAMCAFTGTFCNSR
jgi:hypothetical protein